MRSRDLSYFTMIPTPFTRDLALDEEALRAVLRRLVKARNGLYLSSGGAGEAAVLTLEEMRRISEIAVEEGKGRVPVYAGLRESRSAAAMYEIASQAIAAGVDAVQLYQLDNGHGMIPTVAEQEAYWTELLNEISTPVVISIHYEAKFKAPPAMLERLCARYDQIVAFNLVNGAPSYYMTLRDTLPDSLRFYVGLPEFVQFAALGAAGCINPSGTLIPNLCRSVVDGYAQGDLERVANGAQTVQRFLNVVSEWAPSTARWVKMAMKVQGLGNGVLRPPYLLPSDDDQRRMGAAFAAMRLNELEADAAVGAAR